MIRTVSILALVLAGFTARAGDLTEANAYFTINQSISLSGLNTNSVAGTNYIEDALYHTWYFQSTSNLNGAQIAISFSGDKTNWQATWATMGVAQTASAAVLATTNAVFKQSYWRASFNGTNITGTLTYVGGR